MTSTLRLCCWILALPLLTLCLLLPLGQSQETSSLQERALNRRSIEKQFKIAQQNKIRNRAKSLRNKNIVSLKKVVDNGDSAGRLDIVILSDGFTEKDLSSFDKTVDAIVDKISDVEPFINYTNYINFWAAWVVSDESGVSQNGKKRNTPFGVKMNGSVLTCDNAAVNKFCDTYFPGNDLTIVVGNVSGGRATGTIAWTTGDATDPDWLMPRPGGIVTLNKDGVNSAVIHELGHAFAHLGDEYQEANRARGKDTMLDHSNSIYQNCSKESDPKLVRWHYWNIPQKVWSGKSSPLHWPAGRDIVGCNEGAFLYDTGVYRPQTSCLMRCDDPSYCPPCMEAAECTFFQYASPIDSVWPREIRHTLWKGETLDLLVKFMSVSSGRRKSTMKFHLSWYIDGVPCFDATVEKSKLSRLKIDTRKLKAGSHEICVKVDFTTPRARMDFGMLTSNCVWVVDVRPEERPEIEIMQGTTSVKKRLTCKAEQGEEPETLQLTASVSSTLPDLTLKARNLPEGANFDAATGQFSWLPRSDQHGLYRPVFYLYAKNTLLETPVDIFVAKEGRNRAPILLFIPDLEIKEGQSLRHTMQAWDPEGDQLLYEASNLPLGASINEATGEFTWTPTRQQSGWHRDIIITAHDGSSKHKDSFDIFVTDSNPAFDTSGQTVELFWKLRDPVYQSRSRAMNQLSNYPIGAQILESIRMLRDPAPSIRLQALNNLKGIFSATIQVDAVSGADQHVAEALSMEYHSYLVHAFFAVNDVLLWSIIDFPEALEHMDKVFDHMQRMQDRLDKQAQKELKHLRQVMESMKSYNEWRRK